MSKIKSASYTRYVKVYKILKNDPLMRKELSGDMVAICRPPDQRSEDFPKEVVYVVDQIHARNLDVSTCTNKDVLLIAYDLLVKNRATVPSYSEPPAEAEDAKTIPAKAKPAKSKNQKPSKTPKPPKAPPASKVKAKSAPEPETSAPKATLKTAPAPPVKSALPAVKQQVRPGIPYVIECAALANLEAALSLMEAAGNSDDICRKLNSLIDEIHRRTIIPSAKESPETAAG